MITIRIKSNPTNVLELATTESLSRILTNIVDTIVKDVNDGVTQKAFSTKETVQLSDRKLETTIRTIWLIEEED